MAWTELPGSGCQAHALNAPTLHLSHFGSFFALRRLPNSGQTSPSSAASTGWRSGHFGTLQGAIGGTQTHSRRTGSKLGQLHRARQGLVRVPESNTKYGGKAGKTGGPRRRCCCQVSVSPQGFPSEKICSGSAVSGFVPLFTGQLFIVGRGVASKRLTWGYGQARSGMPSRRWSLPGLAARCSPIPTGPTLS